MKTNQAESFLYKLDPRTKILLALLFTLVIFIVGMPPVAAGLAFCFVVLWFVARMPFRKIAAYVKFLSLMVLFLTLMQMLFGPGGHYILKPLFPATVPLIGGRGSLKWEGLFFGLATGLRLMSLILLLPMLIRTTPPHLFSQGLTRLGLNYQAAFTITAALNFVPALEQEARAIMDAQKLRGLRAFEERNIWAKLKAYPVLAVPLIIAAMQRARSMAYAMDSRAFGAHPRRTWLDTIKMSALDYLSLAASIAFCVLALVLNFAL
jgi:energy-coupling factor transport system permease protein